MRRRTKIILGVVILLLLLLAALLWYLLTRPSPTVPTVNSSIGDVNRPGLPGGGIGAPDVNVNGTPDTTVPEPEPTDAQATLLRLATLFAERFGSYSSEGDFENVTDLYVLMTPSMRTWAEGYVADQRAAARPEGYAGVTTRALNARFTAFNEASGTATIVVTTQRREGSTAAGERVYYQDLELRFTGQGNTWSVDFAKWGEAPVTL